MKVFFSMSFRGEVVVGRKIYKILEDLGHTHTSRSFAEKTPEVFYDWTDLQRLKHYKAVFKDLKKADLAVFESSIQSVTIGQMIQECIDNKIPQLILVKPGTKLAFMDGLQEDDEKLLKFEYNQKNLAEVLESGITYLSDLTETRFTMLMPPDITKYLDKISASGTNRSEFIRKLIREKMGKE